MAKAPDIAREKGLPTVDIEVLFGYDSAAITPAAAESLRTIGRALADARLAGGKYVIAGHTDARGNADYNLALSQRRAEAVRGFLIEQFKLPADALIARGFGESKLKNTRNPRSPENRRVQVINWSSEVEQAGR
jgi:outer membrane protein OmpA-like peptidoglycan-associated protein